MLAFATNSFAAVCALLGLLAVFDQYWEAVYGWLGAGLVARILLQAQLSAEAELTPAAPAGGAADFVLQVIVPVAAMLHAGFLIGNLGVAIAVLVVVVSMYRLLFLPAAADADVFQGLPLIWAVLGFLLHAFDATPVAAAFAIGSVAALNLVPLPWPHMLRSARWQPTTRIVAFAAVLSAAVTIAVGFPAAPVLKSLHVFVALYIVALMILTARLASSPSTQTSPPNKYPR